MKERINEVILIRVWSCKHVYFNAVFYINWQLRKYLHNYKALLIVMHPKVRTGETIVLLCSQDVLQIQTTYNETILCSSRIVQLEDGIKINTSSHCVHDRYYQICFYA